ncbi:MAG: tetratricopeptide repeat protein [Myxococcales bacterium]|nr:tetratricopeptide repeat protein [Myxococcales bacterium]
MTRFAADALANEGMALLQEQRFEEAVERFDGAIRVFPQHAAAWKGLGQARLCLGQRDAAAGAFDRAIGLGANGATALWGGAVAHAELGHKVIAQNYLRRALELQPSWLEMARGNPALAAFLELSWHAQALIRKQLGAYSARTYQHAGGNRSLELARVGNSPVSGQSTYISIGLCNHLWPQQERPRMELMLCSIVDDERCAQIIANTAFHVMDSGFFPEPGAMLRDVVGVLGGGDWSRQLPHGYITVPRAWKLRLPLDIGPPPISVAQLVPVSEAEYQLWRDKGPRELDLVLGGCNVADLSRPSAI